ncbi:taspase, threonine aspartase, 1 [Geranomyces variabilis]|uniref:Taspase, threonine aspartase, 1 n=1 Tax=Geranomyces variabilis TaxID=109894 RepID=A0AAD5TEF6_9FUNG|nr:taspase, threonine aspartase, 1 [Geranomyces variabilis]
MAFVCVHAGAGYHAPASHPRLAELVTAALVAGADAASADSASSIPATVAAVAHLEASPLTNAGPGSNLNSIGAVECDASVMDGSSGAYGAVGAVSGIANPIVAAKLVMEYSAEEGPCGRINPLLLAGNGARDWALGVADGGVIACSADELITQESLSRWQRHKQLLEVNEGVVDSDIGGLHKRVGQKRTGCDLEQVTNKRSRGSKPDVANASQTLVDTVRYDTVGAITCTTSGHISCGVSSGGISHKLPGRISSAAHFGAGVYVQRKDNVTVAAATSGTGEQIVTTLFARECVSRVLANADIATALSDVFLDFLAHPWLARYEDRHVGVMLLRTETVQDAATGIEMDVREFWWAHTTETFAVGWMAAGRPHVRISKLGRRRDGNPKKFAIEGVKV